MNLKNKIIISISTIVIFMLAIPFMATNIESAEIGLGIFSILIIVINPIISIIIGILIGDNYKEIWYIPIIEVLMFLLFFFILFQDVETTYLVFAIIYLTLSYTSIIVTNIIIKIKNKSD